MDDRATARDQLESFFGHLDYRLKLHEKTNSAVQPLLATKFNVFDFIAPDENRLSDILACLLDPNGSHSQGDVFLKAFLQEVCDLKFETDNFATIVVKREERTGLIERNRRRIDILIEFRGFDVQEDFALAVENKPWADEQPDQLRDYLKQVQAAYGDNFQILYLSASGDDPATLTPVECEALKKSNQLICESYSPALLAWLETCEMTIMSDKVRWFVRDFFAYIYSQFLEEEYEDE